jgi:hypothetical protein
MIFTCDANTIYLFKEYIMWYKHDAGRPREKFKRNTGCSQVFLWVAMLTCQTTKTMTGKTMLRLVKIQSLRKIRVTSRALGMFKVRNFTKKCTLPTNIHFFEKILTSSIFNLFFSNFWFLLILTWSFHASGSISFWF